LSGHGRDGIRRDGTGSAWQGREEFTMSDSPRDARDAERGWESTRSLPDAPASDEAIALEHATDPDRPREPPDVVPLGRHPDARDVRVPRGTMDLTRVRQGEPRRPGSA
jgi:hypothetical protein